MLLRNQPGQSPLYEHVPGGGELHQSPPGGRAHRLPVQAVTPAEPPKYILEEPRVVAAQREQQVIVLDDHRHLKAQLAEAGIGRTDIGRAGHRLFQDVAVPISQRARHLPPDQGAPQSPRQPGEVRQPVADERDQAARAPRVILLQRLQYSLHLGLVGPGRCPQQPPGEKHGVHRRHLEQHAAAKGLRRARHERGNVELNVGRLRRHGRAAGDDCSERVMRRAPIATASDPPWLRAPLRVTAGTEHRANGHLPGRRACCPRYHLNAEQGTNPRTRQPVTCGQLRRRIGARSLLFSSH